MGKKVWCCAHHHVGCPTTPCRYDCNEGFSNWQRGWSEGKKAFCCATQGKACPPTAPPTPPPPTTSLPSLQCRIPWVLPLPDQAVVREQARLVLPAHGPWLPDHAPALIQRRATLTLGVHALVAGAQRLARLPHLHVLALALREAMFRADRTGSS